MCTVIVTYYVQTDIIFNLHSFIHYLQYLMFVSILALWTAMSMLTVWTLWEVTSVTVLQDTLEMEHTALVRRVCFSLHKDGAYFWSFYSLVLASR